MENVFKLYGEVHAMESLELLFLPAVIDLLAGNVGSTTVFVITNIVVCSFIAIRAYRMQ